MSQKDKAKFRRTKTWTNYRNQRKKNDKVDFITHSGLYEGFNLHHLDLNEANYTDISDDSHFICLNKQTHEMVHWIYRYYKKDPQILDRLKVLLDRMNDLNHMT